MSGSNNGAQNGIGNPISIATGGKFEPVVDWNSPIDPRFAVERLYTKPAAGRNIASGSLGEFWGSIYDQHIEYAVFKKLVRFDNTVYWFTGNNSTTTSIDTGGILRENVEGIHNLDAELRVASEGGRSIISDGTGRLEFYNYHTGPSDLNYVPRRNHNELDEIRWSDGYSIQFFHDANRRVVAYEDNKGQRAQLTWSDAIIADQTQPVITKILVDLDYDGLTFDEDIEVTYGYEQASGWPGSLNNVSSTTRDLASNEILRNFDFEYSGDELVSVQDGRLDENGQGFDYATFDYSSSGRAISSQHFGGADGYTVSDPIETLDGYDVTVTNPLGKETVYHYEGLPNRERLVGVDGLAAPGCLPTDSSVVRGENERIEEVVRRNGSRTAYVRDERGRILTKTEDADGLAPRVTSYTWLAENFRKPLSRTTPELKETFTYDPDGLLLTYSQEDVLSGSPDLGKMRTWSYDYTTLASGLKVMTSMDGPGLPSNGVYDVTTYEYDTIGRVTKTTDPNGLFQEVLAFGPTGQPSLIRDHKLFEWALEYDALGRMTKATFAPNGVNDVTTFDYDIIGQMTSSTDALGRTTSYLYDEARRLVEIETPLGDTISYEHDAMGNVTRTELSDDTGILGYLAQTEYDGLGRISKLLGSNGQTQSFGYDVEDNLDLATDSIGLQASQSYDGLNRLTVVVDRAGFTTGMDYDEDDQLTQYIDPRGIETAMAYNGFGEVVAETSADRGLMSYAYDDRGLVTSYTDGRGIETTYEYDDAGRLLWKRFPFDTSLDQQFIYADAAHSQQQNRGNLISVTDETGKSRFFNKSNRDLLAQDRRIIDDVEYRTFYDTDATNGAEGDVWRIRYPSGHQLRPFYNADGEVTKLTWRTQDPVSGVWQAWQKVIDKITYLPSGPMARATYGDGGQFNATYDSSYRLTGLTDTYAGLPLRDETYSWTNRDNLAGVTDNLNPVQTQSFLYSSREKLTSADGAWGELDYSYDGVGNRTSVTTTQAALTNLDLYNYPADSNRLQDIVFGAGGTRTLTYDAAGNVTYDNRNGQGYGYNYDAAGRMSSFAINGVIQAEYEYNYQGHQVIRRLPQLGQTIHSVFNATTGERIAEYLFDEAAGTSSLIREYIWANGAVVAVFENNELYFVRTDHIGRPVFATDDTGAKVWEASYLPFGGVEASSGPNLELRFPGQWFQAETGLHQNWMRDYDPTLGRYLQADPLGLVDGASVYSYVKSNPGRYVDPKGEQTSLADGLLPPADGGISLPAGGTTTGSAVGALGRLGALAMIFTPTAVGDGTAPYEGQCDDNGCNAQWEEDTAWCDQNFTGRKNVGCHARAHDNLIRCLNGQPRIPRIPEVYR